VPGDIRDPHMIRGVTKDVDCIFNLAALIAIPYSYTAPYQYLETNVLGTCNILQAALENDVQKVIQTSTSEVYGTAEFVPITEEHRLNAQSPYAASKVGSDQLALSFFNSYNLPVGIIRPFNTYGPRQSARAVIPSIIIQLLEKNKISLGDLTPTRDFNYVSDTVDGFIAAMNSSKSIGEVINLGSNFEVSIQETAEIIAEIIGSTIEIDLDEERVRPKNSEVERLFSSNDKAKKLLGWNPIYAGEEGFRKGLELTIDWFRDPSNQKHYKNKIYNK
jgi:dTDP-glucose 4,6-dehydratase